MPLTIGYLGHSHLRRETNHDDSRRQCVFVVMAPLASFSFFTPTVYRCMQHLLMKFVHGRRRPIWILLLLFSGVLKGVAFHEQVSSPQNYTRFLALYRLAILIKPFPYRCLNSSHVRSASNEVDRAGFSSSITHGC
jgi:hypothetical protein